LAPIFLHAFAECWVFGLGESFHYSLCDRRPREVGGGDGEQRRQRGVGQAFSQEVNRHVGPEEEDPTTIEFARLLAAEIGGFVPPPAYR
jgi:hypothetical protein